MDGETVSYDGATYGEALYGEDYANYYYYLYWSSTDEAKTEHRTGRDSYETPTEQRSGLAYAEEQDRRAGPDRRRRKEKEMD